MNVANTSNALIKDVKCKGIWTSGNIAPATGSCGVKLGYASSAGAHSNQFTNLQVSGFCTSVYSFNDVSYNWFDKCIFADAYRGITLSYLSNGTTAGQTGSTFNSVTNCKFNNIVQIGFRISRGQNNTSLSNKFFNVGEESSLIKHPHIQFDTSGNSSIQDSFDRSSTLALTDVGIYGLEVGGTHFTTFAEAHNTTIAGSSSGGFVFRVPYQYTATTGITGIVVNYTAKTANTTRVGTFNITVSHSTNTASLVDEYEYNGSAVYYDSISFDATVNTTTGCVHVTAINALTDAIKLTYTYSITTVV